MSRAQQIFDLLSGVKLVKPAITVRTADGKVDFRLKLDRKRSCVWVDKGVFGSTFAVIETADGGQVAFNRPYMSHVEPERKQHLLNQLTAMCAGLAEFAKNHGHATNWCMFCNAMLTDERSVLAGYGPICARHYGLPWGEGGKKTAKKRVQEMFMDAAETAKAREAFQNLYGILPDNLTRIGNIIEDKVTGLTLEYDGENLYAIPV